MSKSTALLEPQTWPIPPLHRTVRLWAPKHPLRMAAVFRHCWLMNYAMSPDTLAAHLPPGLSPDLYGDEAWLSVVIAVMDEMRPALLPRWCGVRMNQIVYRAAVRYGDRPGVHFLRSDADHWPMAWAGDILTWFRFHYSSITTDWDGGRFTLNVRTSDGAADLGGVFSIRENSQELPSESVYPSLAVAKDFLVQRFVAYAMHPRSGACRAVHVERGEWQVHVVDVEKPRVNFMQSSPTFPAGSARLDSVLYVPEVPYVWSRAEHMA